MARIWRKGQKKTVKIYRFLSTGTIDERIYQRQLSKLGMNSSIFDDISSGSAISAEDLRDIFSLDESTDCLTHKLSQCTCLTNEALLNTVTDWQHLPLNGNMDFYDQWATIDDGLDSAFYKSITTLASFAYVRSV